MLFTAFSRHLNGNTSYCHFCTQCSMAYSFLGHCPTGVRGDINKKGFVERIRHDYHKNDVPIINFLMF